MKKQVFDRRHCAIARGLVYGLTRHPAADGWADFATLASLRLSKAEIAGMTWAGLKAMPAELADDVVLTALRRVGAPLPPWFDVAAEAEAWASVASLAERRVYAAHGFRGLPAADRAAFTWAAEARNG